MSKIYLDAGHGGSDPGAINGNRYEKSDTLNLCLKVGTILSQYGQQILYARKTDIYKSLLERTNESNKNNCDLYISFHRNSFTNNTANGTEIYVHSSAGTKDQSLAIEILDNLFQFPQQLNRGVKTYNFHVLRESKAVSVLIELGFISNTKDNILYDQNIDNYAKAISTSILNYIGVKIQPTQNIVKYKVQVGAFSNKQNANNFIIELKSKGYDAFIVEENKEKQGE